MIRRLGKNLGLLTTEVPAASTELEWDGATVLRGVLDADEVDALGAELLAEFDRSPAERNRTDRAEFRYEMLNRGPLSQRAVAHPRILEVIEPLLGNDCHVIANTAWNNPPAFGGGPWHTDAGPHVPRPADVAWDDRIPYPVFAVGAHLLLRDCVAADGPTAVVPGSHRSGRLPPREQAFDPELTYDGRPPVLLEGRGRRRRPVRLRQLAPGHAGGGRFRSAVPPGALRPSRHRPAAADDRRRQPPLTRGDRAGHHRSRPHGRRSPRRLLLRRLSAAQP